MSLRYITAQEAVKSQHCHPKKLDREGKNLLYFFSAKNVSPLEAAIGINIGIKKYSFIEKCMKTLGLYFSEDIRAIENVRNIDSNCMEYLIEELRFRKEGTEFNKYMKDDKPGIAQRIFDVVTDHLKKDYAQILDKEDRTALHWAIRGEERNAQAILYSFPENERAAYVQKKDNILGATALHRAILRNKNVSEILKPIPIKDKAACLLVPDNNGNTVFHLAVKMNVLAQIVDLFESMSEEDWMSCVQVRNNEGDTFLHLALKMRKADLLRTFLLNTIAAKKSITPCVQTLDNNGKTLLHHLITMKRENLVIEILETMPESDRELCVQVQDNKGLSILHMLIPSLLDQLKKTVKENCFNYAIDNVAIRRIFELLPKEKRATCLQILDDKELSVLQRALLSRDQNLINAMLSNLLPWDLSDCSLAIITGNVKQLKETLEARPLEQRTKYLQKLDKTGLSPLHFAAIINNKKLLAVIIDLVDAKDRILIKQMLNHLHNNLREEINKAKLTEILKGIVSLGEGIILTVIIDELLLLPSLVFMAGVVSAFLEGAKSLIEVFLGNKLIDGSLFGNPYFIRGIIMIITIRRLTELLQNYRNKKDSFSFGSVLGSLLISFPAINAFLEL